MGSQVVVFVLVSGTLGVSDARADTTPNVVAGAALEAALHDPTIARAEPVIDALKQQGYAIVSINRTLLNRVRIRASNEYYLREIVVSPASGNILRDAIVTEYKPLPKTDPEDQTFVPVLPTPPRTDDGAGQ